MNLRRGLRTSIIVLLITVIVWVIADRSVLRTSSEMTVKVSVNCTDPNYRVTVLKPADGNMRVKFTGPGRGIDRVITLQPPVTWDYDLSSDRAARAARKEQHTLPAKEGFARLADDYRVTLAEADPDEVVIRVQAIQRLDVRVVLAPEDEERVEAGAAIEPQEVKAVGLPAELAKLANPQRGAFPDLNLRSSRLQTGESDTQTVDLRPAIAGLDVRFDPPTVTVKNLRLKDFSSPQTISNIPVQLLGPPELLSKYDIRLDRSEIATLTVIAPRSDVLTAADVQAVIVLTADDKPNPEGAPTPRTPEIRFPRHPNVRLKADELEPVRPINFWLTERKDRVNE